MNPTISDSHVPAISGGVVLNTPPRSMTTDRNGDLWATGNTSIFKYSQSDGSVLREITTGQLNVPGGIAIDSAGKIYLSAPNKVQIWCQCTP